MFYFIGGILVGIFILFPWILFSYLTSSGLERKAVTYSYNLSVIICLIYLLIFVVGALFNK